MCSAFVALPAGPPVIMSFSNLKATVVVPAYNDERLIGMTLSTMPSFVDEIFVVDDASMDATVERVLEIDDVRVRVISHSEHTGVGGAVIDDHRAALAAGCDVSVVMAGDVQIPPEYLAGLLRPIADGHADFTKGNRFAVRSSLHTMPWSRRWGSRFLSWCTRAASGDWHLDDSQNGYTAVHRDALSRISLSEVNQGYPFENSMLIHLSTVGAHAVDVAIPAR